MMKNSDWQRDLEVDSGQIRFVHFLSPEDLKTFKRTGYRRSRNDGTAAGRRVPKFCDAVGLSRLRYRRFLSLFVVTAMTEAGTFKRAEGYGGGSPCSVEVPLSLLNGCEVYVFNDDVQNLAAPGAKKAEWVQFHGDAVSLLRTVTTWGRDLERSASAFVCEARLMKPLAWSKDLIVRNCVKQTKIDDVANVLLSQKF